MNTGFITGLLNGLDINQKEQQYKLNERKTRGQEIDLVQREARRVADNDALDEQQTMTQLMNPGLHPDSRAAIVQARLSRRQQAEAYIQSLQGDPDKAKDIKSRYGDLSQMIKPSAIGAGNIPKPTMDMNAILGFLDKSNTAIRGMGDPKFKQAELARRRGIATDVYGAPQSLVDQYLPQFGAKVGSVPGKVGDWQKIDNIPGLAPELQQGGSVQQPGGMTLETAMQGGELMKRYKQPDTDVFETYQQPEVEKLKADKLKMDLPMIQARIEQIQAKTKAIPQEVQIKYKDLLSKIENRRAATNLKGLAIQVQQEANGIRMWGLQRTHERGMMGLGLRQAQFGLNVDKFNQANQHWDTSRLDRLSALLDKHISSSAKGVQLGQPQISKAEDAMARALKSQIDSARAYTQNADNDDYNDQFIDSELAQGGLQRPSRGLPMPGDVSYNYGNYGGLTPEQMAMFMQRGAGYNAGVPSPLYGGGALAGGAGTYPGNYVTLPTQLPSPQQRQVLIRPNGAAFTYKNSVQPIPIKDDKGPHSRLGKYIAPETAKK